MKLRIVPVLVTVVVTSIILFGSWFAYQNLVMKNPLHKVLHETPDIEDAQIHIHNKEVSLRLTLNSGASLRETIQHIKAEGASAIGNKELRIDIHNDSNKELDQWWTSILFQVAQAMETRQYGLIPEYLQKESAKLDGLQVSTEIDDHNVYVRLVQGDHSKFIILPRVPRQLGVWE